MEKTHYKLRINKRAIGDRQLGLVRSHCKGHIISQVQGQYGYTYDEDFWQQPIEEGTPKKLLWDKLLEVLVRDTICEELLGDYDLLCYKDFQQFERKWQKNNEQRQQAVARNEVIYGPIHYTRWDYYQYLLRNGMLSIKKQWVESASEEISERTLRTFMDANPGLIGKMPDSFHTKRLYLSYVTDQGVVDRGLQRLGKYVLQEVYQLLQKGTALEEITQMWEGVLQLEEKTFGGGHLRTDQMTYRPVLDVLHTLAIGAYSQVIESNGAYQIVFLITKEIGEVRDFESVRDFLLNKYMDQKLEEMVIRRSQRAQIELLEPLEKILDSL